MRGLGVALTLTGVIGALAGFVLQVRALPGQRRITEQLRGVPRRQRRRLVRSVLHAEPVDGQHTDLALLLAGQLWDQRRLLWSAASCTALTAGLLLTTTAGGTVGAVLRTVLVLALVLNMAGAALLLRQARGARRFLLAHPRSAPS